MALTRKTLNLGHSTYFIERPGKYITSILDKCDGGK